MIAIAWMTVFVLVAARCRWQKLRATCLVLATRVLLVKRRGLQLQAWWRMVMARRFCRELLRQYTRATVFLQRVYRGAKVRQRVAIVALKIRWLAVRLQTHVRALFARRRVWRVRLEWCRRHQAASMLQRIYRCVCSCMWPVVGYTTQ